MIQILVKVLVLFLKKRGLGKEGGILKLMAMVGNSVPTCWDSLKDQYLQSIRGKQALPIWHPQTVAHVLAATNREIHMLME